MRARLIHPVAIIVANIDTDASTYDEDFEEGTTLVYETAITVKGQVRIYRHQGVTAGGDGIELLGDGYILMTTTDADRVELNAKVSSIGGNAVEYTVLEKRPAIHYGTNEMMRVFYKKAGKSAETR